MMIPYNTDQRVDVVALVTVPVVPPVVKVMRLLSSHWSPPSHSYYSIAVQRCIFTVVHVGQRLNDTELELPPEIWLYILKFINRADYKPPPPKVVLPTASGLAAFPVLEEREEEDEEEDEEEEEEEEDIDDMSDVDEEEVEEEEADGQELEPASPGPPLPSGGSPPPLP